MSSRQTLEEFNHMYRNYDFKFVEIKKRVLGLKVDSRKNEFPIFTESFELNISTNIRLKIGMINHFCQSSNYVANQAVYPIVGGKVQRVDFEIVPSLAHLDGIYDGSDNIVVIDNTIYTNKIGSWIGSKGKNVKMLSKVFGVRVQIKSLKSLEA